MIDVVFNLIIFFLVASHFSRSQSNDPVALPAATQASDADELPHRLTTTVTSTGAYRLADREVTLADLDPMIAEGAAESSFAVHIRGDKSVPYEFIEPLLLACAKHGVTSVKFHVEPK
jgi:biopolymer transport protein ExbD